MSPHRPRLLFVDDEPSILKALRRLFMDEDWTLHFATSGVEGLELLSREPVDLVVSDVRTPGMDGAAFLRTVKERHPQVARIFLSGYADKDSVTQALAEGYARQILPKPWDEGVLRQVIIEVLQQSRQQQQKDNRLQTVVNAIAALPTLPVAYRELRDCFADRDSLSAERVAEVVRQDMGLSATLLHWGNSALFGQMQQVDTVKRAIVVLGMDIVEGLFLSALLAETLGPGSQKIHGFDSAALQQHAMSCATLARLLVRRLPQAPPLVADQAFTAGLLHDMGKLVAANYLAEPFTAAVAFAREHEALLIDAEKAVLQLTHEELGGYLADWWSLPAHCVQAVRWHHEPEKCTGQREIVEAVHLANGLAQQFGWGRSGNCCLPPIDRGARDRFGLDPAAVASLKDAVERLGEG